MISKSWGVCWEQRCVYDDTDLWRIDSEENTRSLL